MRIICECGTTMRDVEQAKYSVFQHCEYCKDFASKCWQFAVTCAGGLAEQWFMVLFKANIEKSKRRAL